jgi:Tol biopolymer transport system component
MRKVSLRKILNAVVHTGRRPAAPPGSRRPARRLTVEPLEDRCLPSTLQAISVPDPHQPPSDTAAGISVVSAVSADGRYVAFQSTAPNLVAGQAGTPYANNVFLLDRSTGATTLVSHVPGSATTAPTAASAGAPFTVDSSKPIMSRDGRFIVYTAADQITGGNSTTVIPPQVVLYDRTTGLNTLISHTSDSLTTPLPGEGASTLALSGNGRYLVFQGPPTGVVPNEVASTGAGDQFYLYDRLAGITVLVTHASGLPATTADRGPQRFEASVADDGTVAFSSVATNLVGSPSAGGNVYLYTPATETNQRITANNNFSLNAGAAVISSDGSAVAYDLGGELYRYDRHTGTATLVSGAAGSSTVGGNAASGGTDKRVAISPDGRFIAFVSDATNLVPGQSGAAGNVFLYDAAGPALALLSGVNNSTQVGAGGTAGSFDLGGSRFDSSAGFVTLSDDGSRVAYASYATNIVPGQTTPPGIANVFPGVVANVFVYSRATGQNALVSGVGGSATATSGADSEAPVLSANGNLLAFTTRADDLAPGVLDGNGVPDVLAYTPGSTGTTLVSRAAFLPAKHGGDSFATSVSADGRYTVFTSLATNLIPNQSTVNGQFNVYLYDKVTQVTTLVNHVPGFANATGDGGVPGDAADPSRPPRYLQPVISADGNYIAFISNDDNLVPREQRGLNYLGLHVYLYDRRADQIKMVSHFPGRPTQPDDWMPDSDDGYYWDPVISADGRYVAYVQGKVLSPIPVFNTGVIVLYDRTIGETTLVTLNDLFGTENNPSISDDGRFIAYEYRRSVALYDQVNAHYAWVSHTFDSASPPANDFSIQPVVSHDGSSVAFVSRATNLVAGQVASSFSNVFVYDVATTNIRLVSGVSGSGTVGGNGNSDSPAVGLDGGYVAYRSDATNLVAGQSSPAGNVFEFNRQAGTQTLVSHQAGANTNAAGGASQPVIDDDGHLISYVSTAGNLIPGQSGPAGVKNVFLWLRQTDANILASGQNGSPTVTGNADSDGPLLTRHSFPGFSSRATNLIAGLGGTSVAYINTLVQLSLSPNTVPDGSPAGSRVGAVVVSSLLQGQYLPPQYYHLPGTEADNASFSLDGNGTLATGFVAGYAGRSGYQVSVHTDIGFGDIAGDLGVLVAPPPLTVTVDRAPGQLESSDGSTVRFTVTFSQPVVGFTAQKVDLGGLPNLTAAILSDSNDTTFTIAVSGMGPTAGPVTAWVHGGVVSDRFGTPNDPAPRLAGVTYNPPPLTVTIRRADGQPDPVGGPVVHYTVTFSQPVSDFVAADVDLTPAGLTATVSGGGTTYEVAVRGMTQAGTVTATVHGGVAHDGNGTANQPPDPPGPASVAYSLTAIPALLGAVARAYALSREHYTQFVVNAYQQLLKRSPDAGGLEFWVSNMLEGPGYEHSARFTDEQVEAAILCSAEYLAAHHGAGRDWVVGMYQDLLGRSPSAAEIDYWLAVLAGGTPATAVAHGFAASTERETQRIVSDYQTYLGRPARPDEVDGWLQLFLKGTRNEDIVGGFVGSLEYWQRPDRGSSDPVTWIHRGYLDVLFRAPGDGEVNYWLHALGY